jgi:quercetin dioxygenase-like cupin family protein
MTLRVEDETRRLGPGDAYRIDANSPHEARAGSEGAVVIDVFAPGRSDWDAADRLEPQSPRWP